MHTRPNQLPYEYFLDMTDDKYLESSSSVKKHEKDEDRYAFIPLKNGRKKWR